MKSSLISLFVLMVLMFEAISVTMVSETAKYKAYTELCKLAGRDYFALQTFRKKQIYRAMVEGLNYPAGKVLAQEIIQRYPHLLRYCSQICLDDQFGAPLSYDFSSIGRISPSVLRYIKVVGDLQREFGDLNNLNIVEIGAGFGGQCKVIHDICGFASYTMIDLPEVAALIKVYLEQFALKNIAAVGYAALKEPKKYDLVISNYAFSEIDKKGQLYYMEKVINLASRGYMLYNNTPSVHPFSIEEFVSLLKKQQKKVKVLRETPDWI